MTPGPLGHDDRHLGGPGRRRLLDREVRGPGVVIHPGAEGCLTAPDLSGVPTQAGVSLEELIEQTPERLVVGELLGRW